MRGKAMFDKTRKEQIKALKPYFPKVNKAVVSIASRPDETGATWTAKATRVLNGIKPRKSENRACPCRYSVRTTEALSREFNTCRGTTTTQDALTEGIELYILNETGRIASIDDCKEAAIRLVRKYPGAWAELSVWIAEEFNAELEQVQKEKTAASGNDTDSGNAEKN